MNSAEQNELAERFRSRMHEAADMICDILLMKMEMESVGRSVQSEPATQPAPTAERGSGLPSRMKLKDIISMKTQTGVKPVNVTFPNGAIKQAARWKTMAEAILHECAKIPECMEWMRNEALTGSKHKTHFSRESLDPNRSIKVADRLYFNFQTATYYLLKRLIKVMDEMGYDYSQIEITVREAKDRHIMLPKDVAAKMPISQIKPYISGRKPTKLSLSYGRECLVETWVEVARNLFSDCYDDQMRSKKLEALANNIYSPKGILLLSKDPSAFARPLSLEGGFYVEAATSGNAILVRMIQILETAGYDCDSITVSMEDRQSILRENRHSRAEDEPQEEGSVGPTMSM